MSGEIDLGALKTALGSEYKIVIDADRNGWVYRRVNSMLERRSVVFSEERHWCEVTGEDFRHMTPEILRHVADILEGKGGLALGGKWEVVTEKKHEKARRTH